MSALSYKIAIGLSVVMLSMSGCASKKDTFGAHLSEQGEIASDIAARYSEGNKLISDGEAKVKKGKKLINRGEKQQSQGEKMISRGEEMKLMAKTEYCQKDQYRDPNCAN